MMKNRYGAFTVIGYIFLMCIVSFIAGDIAEDQFAIYLSAKGYGVMVELPIIGAFHWCVYYRRYLFIRRQSGG